MSEDIIFVLPDTPLAQVAQAMLEKGVHHILVIDDERRLHGIISSLDFVRLAAESG